MFCWNLSIILLSFSEKTGVPPAGSYPTAPPYQPPTYPQPQTTQSYPPSGYAPQAVPHGYYPGYQAQPPAAQYAPPPTNVYGQPMVPTQPTTTYIVERQCVSTVLMFYAINMRGTWFYPVHIHMCLSIHLGKLSVTLDISCSLESQTSGCKHAQLRYCPPPLANT